MKRAVLSDSAFALCRRNIIPVNFPFRRDYGEYGELVGMMFLVLCIVLCVPHNQRREPLCFAGKNFFILRLNIQAQ